MQYRRQNLGMVNRIWPTAVAGEAERELTLSASACHIGGTNSVNHGQILLVYGTYFNMSDHKNLEFGIEA